jgi:hypothetical protein
MAYMASKAIERFDRLSEQFQRIGHNLNECQNPKQRRKLLTEMIVVLEPIDALLTDEDSSQPPLSKAAHPLRQPTIPAPSLNPAEQRHDQPIDPWNTYGRKDTGRRTPAIESLVKEKVELSASNRSQVSGARKTVHMRLSSVRTRLVSHDG